MNRPSNRRNKSVGRKSVASVAPSTTSKARAEYSGVDAPSRASSSFWRIVGIGIVLICLLGGGLLANRWMVGSRVQQLRRACDQAARAADWPNLERSAREWAVLEPNAVRPWTLAASAARAMGDLSGCADYLSQLPDTAPVEAFHELSLLQMETLMQPLPARQTCQRAVRLFPDDNESSLRLLFIHIMLCERQAAMDEAKRAIRAGADSRETYAYLFAANWITFANGDELNKFWLQGDPENELFQVAAFSHSLYHADKSPTSKDDATAEDAKIPADEQSDKLQRLRERYPDNFELRMIAMSNYVQTGQVAEISKLLESHPLDSHDDSRYWRFKGWVLADHEQWQGASEAYQRGLDICPFDFSCRNELAGVVRRSQSAEAARDLQTTANLGIDLELAFLRAPNFSAVSDADYARLAEYLELCGETEFSNGLRKHLR